MEIRVVFSDNNKLADFVFMTPVEFQQAYNNKQYLNGVFGRGIAVISDKDSLIPTSIVWENTVPLLTEETFNQNIKDLFFHLLYAKNKVSAGELLTAKNTIDIGIAYWNYKNFPTEQEVLEHLNNHPHIIRDLATFFFYNYSQYLYPTESTHFRQKISKYIAAHYVEINLSVQKYIEKNYENYLRLSVKKQNNENSKKMYIDILDGIENDGLPWMNTLVHKRK